MYRSALWSCQPPVQSVPTWVYYILHRTAEVKNAWSLTPKHPIHHGVMFGHSDNFTFNYFYGLNDRSSILDRSRVHFLFDISSSRVWGPPSLLSNGYRGLFLRGVKRSGREADHSPPPSAEDEWSYISTPRKSSWRGA
jgi:hypothetical protein